MARYKRKTRAPVEIRTIVTIPSELRTETGCPPPSSSSSSFWPDPGPGSTSSDLAESRTFSLDLLALSVEILENWKTPFTSLLLRDIFTIFSPEELLLPSLFSGSFVVLEDFSKIDKIYLYTMTGEELKNMVQSSQLFFKFSHLTFLVSIIITFYNQSEVFVQRWLSVDLKEYFKVFQR